MEISDKVSARVTSATAWDRLANPAALLEGAGMSEVVLKPVKDTGGLVWTLGFDLRGKARRATLSQTDSRRPDRIGYLIELTRLSVTVLAELTAVGREVTEIKTIITVRPLSIRGRLMMPALYLARSRMQGRLEKGLKALARALEKAGRAQPPAGPRGRPRARRG